MEVKIEMPNETSAIQVTVYYIIIVERLRQRDAPLVCHMSCTEVGGFAFWGQHFHKQNMIPVKYIVLNT